MSENNDRKSGASPDPRTAADDIDEDDPRKAAKLANIGKDADVAEAAEQE